MTKTPIPQIAISRRGILAGAIAIACVPVAVGSAHADPEEMAEAMREALGADAKINDGRVKISMPELAENGNVVPLRILVESPMTQADHVKTIYVFSEKNPVPNVVRFHLGPRAGQAKIQANIRLAATQHIHVVARMSNGELWGTKAEVIVTQAACIDGT